ncbi:MAG: CPBP family intramembrane metalloprotease [Acidimicrobiia bacterium]|nr:CPBP family intramembrane metalloprotease [Acidimicrobiia bacterium]
MTRRDHSVAVLLMLAGYNVVQNLAVSERGYVPANLLASASMVRLGRRAGLSLGEIGLAPERAGAGLALGAVVATAVGASAAVAASNPRFHRWMLDERARGHNRRGATYRSLVRFPLGTALFEELAFRGVLDAVLRRRSDRSARAVTAVAFGAWHLIPTFRLYPGMGLGNGNGSRRRERVLAALGSAVVTGVSSFGFTALRERSGSVVAPWLAHAAYNTGFYLAARQAWRAR